MTETDYKKVLCMLINDGLVSYADVMSRVGKIAVDTGDNKYQTETYEAARRLIVLLNEKLIANGKKPAVINVTSLGSLEKLIRIDGHTEQDVADMIEWCQAEEFWHSVILSTTKLRKHFDTMLAQRSRAPRKTTPEFVHPIQNTVRSEDFEKIVKESVPMPQGFKLALRGKK